MTRPRLILLPGLHGTGELFAPLLPHIEPELRPSIIQYPIDQRLGYDELLTSIERELMHEPALVLLAESFSGPLAIRYASRYPQQVRAIVLCATFIRSPLWPVAGTVISWFVRSPPPKLMLRWLLLGRGAPRPLCRWVQKAIARVDAKVIAHRLREVQRLDVTEELARCAAPMLYLQARDDSLVGPGSLRQILAVKQEIAVENLPGPHMLLQLAPAEAWKCAARFLVSIGQIPSSIDIDYSVNHDPQHQ